MARQPAERKFIDSDQPWAYRRHLIPALITLTLVYALLAGLRTVSDPDVGWQLAAGRYIVQHHQIPRTDVFSYTAAGHEWIYPVLSQIFLYAIYAIAGFAGLSCFNAVACVATVSICFLSEVGLSSILLAILAIPAIAYRTAPRADLFTTVFFAATLVLLWRHHRGKYSPLWTLPIIFMLWANTHLGFAVGFVLFAAFIVTELTDFLFLERRAQARVRLRKLIPWLLASALVTLLNPWGFKVYSAIITQQRELGTQQNVIGEWIHIPLLSALAQAQFWRDPASSYFWLLLLAAIAICLAARKMDPIPALVLVGLAYESLNYVRFQSLFVIAAIVVGAPYFSNIFFRGPVEPVRKGSEKRKRIRGPQLALATMMLASAGGALLLGVRIVDLVTQRAYLPVEGITTLFGTGLSRWYPERAIDFISREKLPANIFHNYSLGGYLSFRLFPEYNDYIDGRSLPFGADLILSQRALLRQPPDAAPWQREADERGINTLIFSVARYAGLRAIPLAQFCSSQSWKPVYLDDTAVVLLRNRPENADSIRRFQIDCSKQPFDPPSTLLADNSSRGRAQLFDFYANAGSILSVLSRNSEAHAALDRAQQIFPDDPNLHLTLGQLYEVEQRPQDAEREYRIAAALHPSEDARYSLALLFASQHRYPEAVTAVREAAALSPRPAEHFISLGMLYLAMNQPRDAQDALDRAEANENYEPVDVRPNFDAQLASARASVAQALNRPVH